MPTAPRYAVRQYRLAWFVIDTATGRARRCVDRAAAVELAAILEGLHRLLGNKGA